ncbi:galactose oxidase-like domain-containing protein [Streptomyces sp. NPDC002574]|uniref:galactose oxidase-like domain-containing protein n=1 Tax=Streptomyces sp. NPDC002574 TaxID=3364652 RepID=UPI00368AF3F3
MTYRPSRRLRKIAVGSTAVSVLAGMNAPALYSWTAATYHDYKIDQPEYKAAYGHWEQLDVPKKYRINAIHAALLHTGKVLLIAGSGNDETNFEAKSFKSVLWDPVKNTFKEIDTPKDMFCAGHTQLPDGRLLVAGGTARYEKLKEAVDRAGGAMLIKNENPDTPRTFPQGTVFVNNENGRTFRSEFPVTVPRAKKTVDKRSGKVTVTAAEVRVFVQSLVKGEAGIVNTAAQYEIRGLEGRDRNNLYGLATKLGLDKKDFQGIKEAYEFDPVAERYIPVDPMNEARWYPTLVTLADGRVLSVSGLDDIGQVVPGKNEIYDPRTRKWTYTTTRYFPTYPALFLMQGEKIFYSGANAGYGPADEGRVPGVWDLRTNRFTAVPGLRDAKDLETASSVLLAPAQDQKVMVLGGGGVGESRSSTARTAVVDLNAVGPAYTDGPDLPEPTRYLNSVLLPDDTVFTTGGSRDYRGRGGSDILRAQIYDPVRDVFRDAADPAVGRDYHAEALLLPDGRVAVFGSNPLFGDKADTTPGFFEQRVEIYTPPYLYRDSKPSLGEGPRTVERGGSMSFPTQYADHIDNARLIRPSAVTHATDTEQRSIALDIERGKGSVRLTVPQDPSLVPPGWYMVVVTDEEGTPSVARWVKVS